MFDSDSSRDRDANGPLHAEAPARPNVADYVLAMSHELRAPLNAVIGMSGLLLGGELGERQRQYAKSVHAAGESLSTILNDLIDLSRVMAGRLPIEPIPFDLRSMVEETVKALGPRAADRGLALRVDWRPELPRQVVGDPGRTRQVLGNLVGRALNATSQGEIAILVTADGENEGREFVRFSVEDTGIGLPESRLGHIFDEYTPIDASPYRSFGTTGLGLRVSAELVRLMGGEIGAESEVGKGSRFWFRLPLPAADNAADLVLDSASVRTGGRALIVETDQASRRRFEDQIKLAGWDADFVDDITEVEERLRGAADAGSPYRTCVLSDYAVRPFHAELALRLKTDDKLSPVALIMATAVGSPGEGKRLWHAGFTAYLRKPIPNEEMSGTLLALDHVGPDGRNSSLITRHSLAEARLAQSATAFDGIDEVLASLTASITRKVLVLGTGGTDQIEITEALAQCDLMVEAPTEFDHAIERLARHFYEMVIVDADHDSYRDRSALERIAREMRELDPKPPFVAITVDPAMRDRLLAAGVEHVLAKPFRRTDLERIARRAAAPVDEADTRDETADATEVMTRSDPAAKARSIVADTDPVVPDDADESDEQDPSATPTIDIEPTSIPAVGAPVASDQADSAIVAVESVDTTPVGELIQPRRNDDPPAAESKRTAEAGPVIDVTPISGMVRLDPDQTVDAEPLPGLIVNEMEMEMAGAGEEAAVIEPVALANHGLGPDTVDVEPDRAIHDSIEPEPVDLNGNGTDHETIEPGSATALAEPVVDSVDLTPETEADIVQPADDEEADSDDAPVLGLDFGEAEPDTDSDDESEEAEALGAISADAPEVSVDGDADPEEIAFLAPTTPDVVIDSPRLVSPADHVEAADDKPVAAEAAVSAAEEAAGDPDLPVIATPILDQLGSQSGGFAQHLVATFLKDAPQRIGELATAASRGNADQLTLALRGLRATSGLLGAARLGALCDEMQASLDRDDLEGATQNVGALEHAFLQVRLAVEAAAPPQAKAPAELPAIGAGFIDQLSPDADPASRSLAMKLVDAFRSEAPTRLAELTDAIVREDSDAVQRLAPALKGMCGLIGADPLAKLCALVEADARLRRIASARRYVDQLQLELTRVLDALGRAVD